MGNINLCAEKSTRNSNLELYRIIVMLLIIAHHYVVNSGVRIEVTAIESNFASCFLIFYLCIPFLNILVRNMSQKQHLALLGLLAFTYVFLGIVPNCSVTMNDVSCFICLYFLSSYIRLYPKEIFSNTKVWAVSSLVLIWVCVLSVLFCVYTGRWAYRFVCDSNTLLAVCLGVSSFLFFKNLKIRQSKFINTVAETTFGVLCIHACSDAIRQWLWQTVLNVPDMFYKRTRVVILHAVLSVLGIFIVCSLIDLLRIWTLERIEFNRMERAVQKRSQEGIVWTKYW